MFTILPFTLSISARGQQLEGTSWSSAIKTPPPNAGGLGSIPGQELRSHMVHLSVHMPQLKAEEK